MYFSTGIQFMHLEANFEPDSVYAFRMAKLRM
jgi:hypothetical protein